MTGIAAHVVYRQTEPHRSMDIMATHKKKHTLLATIFRAVAPRIGATVTLDPEWGIAGQISYPNGRNAISASQAST